LIGPLTDGAPLDTHRRLAPGAALAVRPVPPRLRRRGSRPRRRARRSRATVTRAGPDDSGGDDDPAGDQRPHACRDEIAGGVR
jgi:hypothetical protein